MALWHTRCLFELLGTLGYDDWVGCEYRPAGKTERWIALFPLVGDGTKVGIACRTIEFIGSGREFLFPLQDELHKKAAAFNFFDTRTITSRNGLSHVNRLCSHRAGRVDSTQEYRIHRST